MEKGKIIEVTMVVKYFIPYKCNGWSYEQTIEEWFKDFPLFNRHASRDTHKIGNSERFISYKEIEKIFN